MIKQTKLRPDELESNNNMSRPPDSRLIYKELIKTETKDLESILNGVRYGKRALFIKQKK